MRINNLEFRKSSYIGNPPEHIGWEICLWESNVYYGHESDFIKKDNYYYCEDKPWWKIHEDCFKHPESCFTIASWDYKDGCYEFSFVGDRPIRYLETDEDWNDFRTLIKLGFSKLNSEE